MQTGMFERVRKYDKYINNKYMTKHLQYRSQVAMQISPITTLKSTPAFQHLTEDQ